MKVGTLRVVGFQLQLLSGLLFESAGGNVSHSSILTPCCYTFNSV